MLRKYINKKDLFGEKDFKWRGGDVSRLESLVDGVFAIALYDSHKNKLYCARDPIGVRSMYIGITYAIDSSTKIFINSILQKIKI